MPLLSLLIVECENPRRRSAVSERFKPAQSIWLKPTPMVQCKKVTLHFQPGRRWVAAQSLTESGVYQPDKELSVDIGDSATLQCCEHVTIESETSKPALGDNSVGCEPTLHGNSTNMNTQEKTVLGLGTALGLCALLIFCLIYFILRRRKWDKINASVENSPGMNQESEAETLNYAAVHFSKRKPKAETKKSGSSDECVYADVKKTARCNINDS
ncbi:uncharacterized protein LOC132890326 [Neoarius graeffei]|uniref:uncharacterized protein LOC132890326 n=1 Tax=Neoarius graeffei TaxID=443677 RepID=UPI00298C4645|nr:uncharacterized protein LOC132890326 [Neoarius graeffei]